MTVNAAPRSAGPFTGDGTNTSFPFGFKTLASDDLIVVVGGSLGETVLVKDTDYTVALNPDQGVTPGGTVTYPISGPAMDSQHRLSVISGVPYEQATTLPNGGPFNPVTIEKALDNLAMQTQQVVEKVGRSMQIPVTSPEDATVLAAAVLAVKDNLPHIVGADQNKANIDAVVANATNINAVAGNATNINKVAAIDAAVTTVAAIDAAVTTVATNIADVGTVATNIANVSAAGANTSNINAVATDISNVNAVATNIANVNTVATDSANVATVATNIASVNTVAPNVGDVATVAADIVAVVDVSTNKAAILNAADKAQKWAENPEDVAVTPGQYSALHWAKKAEGFAGGAIIGPASSTDSALVLFDGTDGKKGKVGPLLTTSATDTTAGRVTKVGDFGLGVPISIGSAVDLNDLTAPGFFTWTSSAPTNAPGGAANCDLLVGGLSQHVFLRDVSEVVWYRCWSGGSWQPWVALHHTGNIKKTLGSDDDYPISQKAVTDAFVQPTMRNRVINGGCLVAQRGDVAAVNNALTYGGCDRIAVAPVGFTTCSGTIQHKNIGVGTKGFSQALTGVTTTGSGDIQFVTRLEARDVADLNSKQITIQANFYHDYGSALNCGFIVSKAGAFDDFSSPTVLYTGATTSVPSGSTTSVKTTFTMGVSDCTNGLQIIAVYKGVGAVSGKWFHIADLQMEEGAVATRFEHRPYALELALCQRYYEITDVIGTLGYTDNVAGRIVYRVDKRVLPTITAPATGIRWYRTGVFDITSTGTFTPTGIALNGCAFTHVAVGVSAGPVVNSSTAAITVSAEL